MFDCVCSIVAVLERRQVLFTLSGRDGRRRSFRPGRWLVNVDAGTGQRQGQLLGALGAGAGPVEDLVHRAGHASHVFTGDDGVGGAKVCAAHSVVVVVVLVWIFFSIFSNIYFGISTGSTETENEAKGRGEEKKNERKPIDEICGGNFEWTFFFCFTKNAFNQYRLKRVKKKRKHKLIKTKVKRGRECTVID